MTEFPPEPDPEKMMGLYHKIVDARFAASDLESDCRLGSIPAAEIEEAHASLSVASAAVSKMIQRISAERQAILDADHEAMLARGRALYERQLRGDDAK